MKSTLLALSIASMACAAMSEVAWAQTPGGWQVEGSRKAPPYRLVLPKAGGDVSYIFDCSGSKLVVTQTGVTELLDLEAGNNARIPDTGEVRTFPAGSAQMAIATGRGDPDFILGSAQPNAVKGWDITIRLPRDHKSVEDLGRTDFVILFTTGFTAAAALDKADKRTVSNFAKECRK